MGGGKGEGDGRGGVVVLCFVIDTCDGWGKRGWGWDGGGGQGMAGENTGFPVTSKRIQV